MHHLSDATEASGIKFLMLIYLTQSQRLKRPLRLRGGITASSSPHDSLADKASIELMPKTLKIGISNVELPT